MEACKNMCCSLCAKWKNRSLSLLIIRVVLGAIFIAHGWQKIQAMDQVITFFGTLGLAPWIAYAVTWIEFIGGIALVLGVATCLAGLLLAIVMIGSIVIIMKGPGGATFIASQPGVMSYELNAMLLAAALGAVFAGPGKYSLGGMMKKGCNDGNCQNCK